MTPADIFKPPAASGARANGAVRSGEAGPRTFNRDLSWLEFNRRVLAQAADDRTPLLERVRFLSIFSSNLDEFFMKRVGLIRRQIHAGVETRSPDGLTPRQQLVAIRKVVLQLQEEQSRLHSEMILPALASKGVRISRWNELSKPDRVWAEAWYRDNVFPTLTPLAVDSAHRFPFISNLSENLGVLLRDPRRKDEDDEAEPLFARVKIPGAMKRYIQIAPAKGNGKGAAAGADVTFVSLDEVIKNNLDDLFPGMELHNHVHFRVTRSAGIQRDDFETVDLLQSVEEDLRARKFARAVRLEIEPDPAPSMLRRLQDRLNLDALDVYELSGLIEYNDLSEIADLERPELKHKPWRAVVPRRLAGDASRTEANLFGAIRKQDILLHHPYESFSASVERFIRAAAEDPAVVAIKQTLYRSSPDSPFIESLIRAAESGKTVACLVELRARFDEGRNVKFARQLERAGVHVAYGVLGLKTHCKTSLVVRKEKNGLRCYAHIGTGNYHPKTAQLYTDVGLLTCDPGITADLVHLFNSLTGYAATQSYNHLLVAPVNMRETFNALIDREIAHARRRAEAAAERRLDPREPHPDLPAGGRIIAKINSMEDPQITERLYEASRAGVQITLIVRGFCCLRPGVPGLSENISVVSIIGRYLEHSRIFHFGAGFEDPAEGEWYISSADWMYRNLSNRVEAACPVRDAEARKRLYRIIQINLADHRHAWDLNPEGDYVPRGVPEGADAASVQARGTFETLMADTEATRDG